ncbi:MAG: hypothetical protein FJ098_14825 [Deltaproteobacteria bacterium]|nr:hypothetical protein [Deltaproteobacteria bacterium]
MNTALVLLLVFGAVYPTAAESAWPLMEDQPKVQTIRGDRAQRMRELVEQISPHRARICVDWEHESNPSWELRGLLAGDSPGMGDSISAVRLPLRGDDRPALLLKVVISGTGHYVQVLVFREVPGGFDVYEWWGSEKTHGAWHVIHDLDRDGQPEILIKDFVGEYSGASTAVAWTGVWAWERASWVRADQRFPGFYESHVLPELRSVESDLRRADSGSDLTEENLRKLQFVRARVDAITGSSGAVGR